MLSRLKSTNSRLPNQTDSPRIAWLLTSAFFYWQPFLKNYTELFPQTTIFTSRWHGFAPGLKNSIKVEIVGKRKILAISKATTGYGSNFTYLPLRIIGSLLKFKPQVIFSNSFGIWTILALLLKPIGKWRVAIAYEGSSPSVDYRNSKLRLLFRQAMVRSADACITNSNAGKTYLTEFLQAEADRVFVQPYEVPAVSTLSGSALKAELNYDLKQPIFLFVGSIIPRKGLYFLLQACSILRQQGYQQYTLLIVGDGDQQEELEKFCQENNLSVCVRWTGRVEYESLGAYFRNSDVFVFPTLEDTWGVVLLEAMALGKPVICSKLAGASELVQEGENGYCYDPYDPQQLAALMRFFLDDPKLNISMGQKSQELMANYTPEIAAQFLSKVTEFMFKDCQ